MDIKKLSDPLPISMVEFRVQSITAWGKARLLVYKDARADMQRLDDVVGPLNWKREHVNLNKNCIVSIWNNDCKQWVSKEDTGTESNTEKEKGLASDSFKRACFNWGIGRELYSYPSLDVDMYDDELDKTKGKPRPKWGKSPSEWRWFTQFIDGKLQYIAAKDKSDRVRFQHGKYIKPTE